MTGLIGTPEVRIDGDHAMLRFPDGMVCRLTVDEARHLSVQLDDAADELELAEAVSGDG